MEWLMLLHILLIIKSNYFFKRLQKGCPQKLTRDSPLNIPVIHVFGMSKSGLSSDQKEMI